MPKRFYLNQEYVPTKRSWRPPRWAMWIYWVIFLGSLIYALSALDLMGTQNAGSTSQRQSIGSTQTSTELAPVLKREPEEPVVISTVQDTTIVVPPDTTMTPVKEVARADVAEKQEKKIVLPTVTLFNGCGVKGIGARAKAALEQMGFEVVMVRNARNYDYKKSEVLDRRENLEMGKLLADSLGIPKQLAAWDTTRSDRDADVSLIVGSDFKKLRWKI